MVKDGVSCVPFILHSAWVVPRLEMSARSMSGSFGAMYRGPVGGDVEGAEGAVCACMCACVCVRVCVCMCVCSYVRE